MNKTTASLDGVTCPVSFHWEFDQRQRKARKTQSQTAGGGHLDRGERFGKGGGGSGGGCLGRRCQIWRREAVCRITRPETCPHW